MQTMDFLAQQIHRDNVIAGWWDGVERKIERRDTCRMLVVSEIAEAMEGDRKNLMDVHLTERPMLHVELADAAIRVLDMIGAYHENPGLDMPWFKSLVVEKRHEIKSRLVPEMLFYLTTHVTTWRDPRQTLAAIFAVCEILDVPLYEIIQEKREYNAKRTDHSAAVRAAPGGKKY